MIRIEGIPIVAARLAVMAAAPISTQVVQRDRHADYLASLARIAATLEKIALEIRHLQESEVREAEEHFSKDSAKEKRNGSVETRSNVLSLA